MEFASKFALDASDEEIEEEVGAQHFDYSPPASPRLNAAPATGDAPAPPPLPPQSLLAPLPAQLSAGAGRRVKVRRGTTNVASLQMGTLAAAAFEITGDPTPCKQCGAFLNSASSLKPSASSSSGGGTDEKIWECEFCGFENHVIIDPHEVPTQETVDYVTIPAAASAAAAATPAVAEKTIILVLDISGSMSLTSEVEGAEAARITRYLNKKNKGKPLNGALTPGEWLGDQFLPHQRRDTAWVSRLQCIQLAVDSQLKQLAKDNPSARIGLITFASEVSVYGDSTPGRDPVIIAGDKLSNQEQLISLAQTQCCELIKRPISESRDGLVHQVASLEENGQTALGPALLTALIMAGKTPGSTILLATDGCSNVGVGATDRVAESEAVKAASEDFYSGLGLRARNSGVVVNVMSILGTVARLEEIGKVSDMSGGKVTQVDPAKLSSEFNSLLSEDVVATNVVAEVLLHKALAFREEHQEDSAGPAPAAAAAAPAVVPFGGVARIRREIGPVSEETEVTFEYKVKKEFRGANLSTVPFQLHVHFTRVSDGIHRMRVVTKTQNLTRDRTTAEKEAHLDILGTYVAQQSAKIAMAGDYSVARATTFANKQYMKEVASKGGQAATDSYNVWKRDAVQLEDALQEAWTTEQAQGLNLSGDEEDLDEVRPPRPPVVVNAAPSAIPPPPPAKAPLALLGKKKKQQVRSMNREDKTAQVLYQMKSRSSKHVSKPSPQAPKSDSGSENDDEDDGPTWA